MNLRVLKGSPALLCALAAPLLYVAVNLIALQIAAHPTGVNWYEESWDDRSLRELGEAVAQARMVTLGLTLVLAIEAVFLALLDQRSRRPTVNDFLLRGMASVGYLLTLALVIVVNPISSFWELNDDHDLAMLVPGWYMPALTCVSVATLTGLAIWMFAHGRAGRPMAQPRRREPHRNI
ncbi:hypothetical protein [Nonomuraea pusilla]|uniref:Uncharacterized protein n=1 Tax=Nonomuraea pusilla TaxID=46177 RepID=A0A1H8CC92_9ACTN|nr:hypothetical protein [Nonomuraea pusilla]SEM91717.1 hypothetical protein SAMN05660976_06318 [Nonomuraea pusilla]